MSLTKGLWLLTAGLVQHAPVWPHTPEVRGGTDECVSRHQLTVTESDPAPRIPAEQRYIGAEQWLAGVPHPDALTKVQGVSVFSDQRPVHGAVGVLGVDQTTDRCLAARYVSRKTAVSTERDSSCVWEGRRSAAEWSYESHKSTQLNQINWNQMSLNESKTCFNQNMSLSSLIYFVSKVGQ